MTERGFVPQTHFFPVFFSAYSPPTVHITDAKKQKWNNYHTTECTLHPPDVPILDKHRRARSKKLTQDTSTVKIYPSPNPLTNRQSADIYKENKHKNEAPWDRCVVCNYISWSFWIVRETLTPSDICFVLMWILGRGIPKEGKLRLTTIT